MKQLKYLMCVLMMIIGGGFLLFYSFLGLLIVTKNDATALLIAIISLIAFVAGNTILTTDITEEEMEWKFKNCKEK